MPADTALEEYVREWWRPVSLHHCFNYLSSDGPVSLHYVSGNFFVAVIRGIGHDEPTILCRKACRLLNRLIVVACNTNDLGAVSGDRVLSLDAHVGMQHNDATAADALSCCS